MDNYGAVLTLTLIMNTTITRALSDFDTIDQDKAFVAGVSQY